MDEVCQRAGLERELPCEYSIEKDAHGIDVGSLVGFLFPGLLGSHEIGIVGDLLVHGQLTKSGSDEGQLEAPELENIAGEKQDRLKTDLPMDDSAPVSMVEPAQQLRH